MVEVLQDKRDHTASLEHIYITLVYNLAHTTIPSVKYRIPSALLMSRH